MANSVFPDPVSAAGVVIRDVAGNPTSPPDVHNAYPPLPSFVSTCEITALPSNCDARIEPRQINAIVSELLSFAECLDPNGPWDCNSLKNLCASFSSWAAIHIAGIIVSDTPPPNPPQNILWWESDSGMLFINYNDGNTQQWVQVVAGDGIVIDGVSIVGAGTEAEPYSVGTVDCGTY